MNWMVEQLFNVELRRAKLPHLEDARSGSNGYRPSAADGLALVPYWSGCMTPYWDPKARGVIAGLTASHRRGDVYRAILEGVALEQAMMTDGIAAATQPIDHFVVMGGGAHRIYGARSWPMRRAARSGARDGRGLFARRGHGRGQGRRLVCEHSAAAREHVRQAIQDFHAGRKAQARVPRAAGDLRRPVADAFAMECAHGRLSRKEPLVMERIGMHSSTMWCRRLARSGNRKAGQGALRDHSLEETLDGGAADLVAPFEDWQAHRRCQRRQHP